MLLRIYPSDLRQSPTLIFLATILIGALAWPDPGMQSPLDNSWIVGLHVAAQRGMQHGTQIVFTHGPLGFLAYPAPYVGWTSLAALGATAALEGAVVASVLVMSRGALTGLVSLPAAYLASKLSYGTLRWEVFGSVAMAWFIAAFLGSNKKSGYVPAVLMGVAAAIALLGKASVGDALFASFALGSTALRRPWWRGLIVFGLATAVALIALWLVLGQDPAHLPAYATNEFQLAIGYTSAMSTDRSGYVAFLVTFAAIAVSFLWTAARLSADAPFWQRWGFLSSLLVFGFLSLSASTTRLDQHSVIFPIALGVASVGFLGTRQLSAVLKMAPLSASVVTLALFLGIPTVLVPSTGSLVNEVQEGMSGGHQIGTLVRESYPLTPMQLSELRGGSVHVAPWDAVLLAGYAGIDWRPLPVFQSYSAYTPALDDLNATFLRSASAPERIIDFRSPPPDHRDPWYESPDAILAFVCSYVPTQAPMIYERVPQRCSSPVESSSVTAVAGFPVTVPTVTPGTLLGVQIQLPARSLLAHALDAFVPQPIWTISLDGNTFRFIPSTAGHIHLLSPPDWPASDTRGLVMPRNLDVVQANGTPDEVTYRFVDVPIASLH